MTTFPASASASTEPRPGPPCPAAVPHYMGDISDMSPEQQGAAADPSGASTTASGDAVQPAGDISDMSPVEGTTGHRSVICVVPGRWGMLAAAGASPAEAVSDVLALEAELVSRGLAETP